MQQKTCFLDYIQQKYGTPCTPIVSAAGRRGVFRLNYRVCRVRQVKAVTHLLLQQKIFMRRSRALLGAKIRVALRSKTQ